MSRRLYANDLRILRLLEDHPQGLTNAQLATLAGCAPRTVRQAMTNLRHNGYRVRADRVFRLRTKEITP